MIIFFVLTRINSKLFKEDLKFCSFLNIHVVKALCYLWFPFFCAIHSWWYCTWNYENHFFRGNGKN